MKKKLVFMALMLALFISILVFSGKARASNSELYENDKQIITLLAFFSIPRHISRPKV